MKHKICSLCGKVGHKRDMISAVIPDLFAETSGFKKWYHEECYMKENELKKCPCGKGYIKKG